MKRMLVTLYVQKEVEVEDDAEAGQKLCEELEELGYGVKLDSAVELTEEILSSAP